MIELTLLALLLIMAGIVAAYPIVAIIPIFIAVAWVACHYTKAACDSILHEDQARSAHLRAIADRADHQHTLTMQGNPAGVYGEYKPAHLHTHLTYDSLTGTATTQTRQLGV